VQNARTAIDSVDVILFVVDGQTEAGGGDRFIANLLARAKVPVLLGVNKIDLQPEPRADEIDDSYGDLALAATDGQGWPLLKFSALTGNGLEALQAALVDRLEPGPYYYPPDLATDQPERFIMGELIREQILRLTREEVPHSVAVAIERVEETPKLTRVHASINVERSSQKGILIGRKGAMLKDIGSAAREQIQKLIDGKIYLELFVRVQPRWRQSRTRLAEFGYRPDE